MERPHQLVPEPEERRDPSAGERLKGALTAALMPMDLLPRGSHRPGRVMAILVSLLLWLLFSHPRVAPRFCALGFFPKLLFRTAAFALGGGSPRGSLKKPSILTPRAVFLLLSVVPAPAKWAETHFSSVEKGPRGAGADSTPAQWEWEWEWGWVAGKKGHLCLEAQ